MARTVVDRVLVAFIICLVGCSKSSTDENDSTQNTVLYEGDDPRECSDGADNDRDSLFDCEDKGCIGSPACVDVNDSESVSSQHLPLDPEEMDTDENGSDEANDKDTENTDPICAESDLHVERKPVALMLLVDMSGSMAPFFNDETGNTWDNPENPGRWGLVKPAIENLLDQYDNGAIQFGYDSFPEQDGNCSVSSAPAYDIAPGNNELIRETLPAADAVRHMGWTPMKIAIANYLDATFAPNFYSSELEKYLLLISDGQDTCGDGNGTKATPAELGELSGVLLEAGIKTLTIGFGKGGSDDFTAQLDAISAAGGTQFTSHLSATSQQELEDAFASLATSIASCKFEIPEQDNTVAADKLNFYFDDEVIPADPDCAENKGWRWGDDTHTEVIFCKEACDTLQNTENTVKATWGCPTIVVV